MLNLKIQMKGIIEEFIITFCNNTMNTKYLDGFYYL